MWTVVLVKAPLINDYRSDYFPRNFYYKKDAVAMKDEVKRKGGEAMVVPAKEK